MAQHDYDIANSDGATVRADLNAVLEAVASANSGASAPSPAFQFMPWLDTANNLLKRRNAANNAWVTIASLVGGVWIPYRDGAALPDWGTAVGELVQLVGVGSPAVAGLPAVDGSQLTGIANEAINDIVIVEDQKSDGTASSTYTGGSWQTATLNTKPTDTASIATLSSNEITLPAGSYTYDGLIHTGYAAGGNAQMRARLYNVTDTAVVKEGVNGKQPGSGFFTDPLRVGGYFTLASSKTLRFEVWVSSNTTAIPAVNNGSVEIWASIMFRRYA